MNENNLSDDKFGSQHFFAPFLCSPHVIYIQTTDDVVAGLDALENKDVVLM